MTDLPPAAVETVARAMRKVMVGHDAWGEVHQEQRDRWLALARAAMAADPRIAALEARVARLREALETLCSQNLRDDSGQEPLGMVMARATLAETGDKTKVSHNVGYKGWRK